MTQIGLLGDVHGNHAWIKFAARQFHTLGITTVIQVGDLGVSSDRGESNRWDRTDRYLRTYGITLLVAPGNHENYDYIEAMHQREDGWFQYRSNILLAPRGLRTEMRGRTFVWLGGAGSVDRTRREEDRMSGARRSWWPQEAITRDDVATTVAGGHANIMISHDAPVGVPEIDDRLPATEHLWNSDDLEYAHACRERFTKAVAGVQPDLLVHGHYHFGVRGEWVHPETGHVTATVGLGMDGDDQHGLGVLETDSLVARRSPAVS